MDNEQVQMEPPVVMVHYQWPDRKRSSVKCKAVLHSNALLRDQLHFCHHTAVQTCGSLLGMHSGRLTAAAVQWGFNCRTRMWNPFPSGSHCAQHRGPCVAMHA